jgi:hypothetical protein
VIGFLLKKFFFDIWDNLFKIAILNLLFSVLCALAFFVLTALPDIEFLRNLSLAAFVAVGSVYLSGVASSVKKIADYRSFNFGSFFRSFTARDAVFGRPIIVRGLAGAVIFGIFCGIFIFILPFYVLTGSVAGLIIAALLFWVLVAAALSLQFFLSAGIRLEKKTVKTIKKCFIIFIDNPLFCVFCFLFSCFLLAISLVTVFLAPGPAGIVLFLDEALRLRLFKYDYLEKIGAKTTRGARIPWDELLAEEQEKTGDRSLKNFIFPWKD